jgi:ribosomal protein S18 acetylase RimI-like enzyme
MLDSSGITPAARTPDHPLDNPARAALLGPQAHLAVRHGQVLRFPADVSPFVGFPDEPDPAAWADLAELIGPGGVAPLSGPRAGAPDGWVVVADVPGVQMVDGGVAARPDPDAVPLGPDDVPEMLDLVARTQPGPFLPRTIEMGPYLGIREGGRLVAMAGERLRPPGWAEISAVCTDPGEQGRGLGSRLVLAVADGIRRRGETPFLHAAAANIGAIRLYGTLGFTLRTRVSFRGLQAPA